MCLCLRAGCNLPRAMPSRPRARRSSGGPLRRWNRLARTRQQSWFIEPSRLPWRRPASFAAQRRRLAFGSEVLRPQRFVWPFPNDDGPDRSGVRPAPTGDRRFRECGVHRWSSLPCPFSISRLSMLIWRLSDFWRRSIDWRASTISNSRGQTRCAPFSLPAYG